MRTENGFAAIAAPFPEAAIPSGPGKRPPRFPRAVSLARVQVETRPQRLGAATPGPNGGEPESDQPRGRALADWGLGALVVLVCALAQYVFRQGPQPFDPAKYFQTAVDFPDVPADLWTLRLGLVFPARLAVLVFGSSEAALYAVPFAAGLLLAAAVYATMLVAFRDRVLAALAALVTALNADFLLRSGSILPDTAATATFTSGMCCLLLGSRRQGRDGWLWTIAAGVAFGWTYLIREFSPILLPTVVAALVLLRYPLRRSAVLVGAALVTAGTELLYGLVRYDDPLVHARLLLNRPKRPAGLDSAAVFQHQLSGVSDALAVFPRLALAWDSGWAILLLAGILAVTLALRPRDRRLWLLGAWALTFWLTMSLLGLGSYPSGRWLLNITSVRYWFPLFPAIVMGAFAGIGLLLSGRRRLAGGLSVAHVVAFALAALTVAPGLAEFKRCSDQQAWPNEPSARWHELRTWLASPEAGRFDTIAADLSSARLLPAYTTTALGRRLWKGSIVTLPTDGETAAPLVLLDKDRFTTSDKAFVDEVAQGRSPIFASGDGALIVLAPALATFSPGIDLAKASLELQPPGRPAATRGTCGRRPY